LNAPNRKFEADFLGISKLLDSFVKETEDASRFVERFSSLWLRFNEDYNWFPVSLEPSLDKIEELYEDAQLLSSTTGPKEVPQLLSAAELRSRAVAVQDQLRRAWQTAFGKGPTE
jgi:hypothetical protein